MQARWVQETMESSRRWSGYVCPDCRFVFRVPRDHDGRGVVCPSCRRMLKLPTAGDQVPPLVVMRTIAMPAEQTPAVIEAPQGRQRRVKKSRHGKEHAWDRLSGPLRRSTGVERRQMWWMLIGGVSLLVLMVVGVFMAQRGGEAAVPAQVMPAAPVQPTTAATPSVVPDPETSKQSDAEFLTEAEGMARKFLGATRIEDMLPWVRSPEVTEARMRGFYADGHIDAPGLLGFNINDGIVHRGRITALNIRTARFEEKALAYVETPDGLKIDWESWVGWSEMPWDVFLKSKPTTAQVFRMHLHPVEYYNFEFSDDSKWQAYQLTSPDGLYSAYGYAERGSSVCAKLPSASDRQRVAVILAMKFPDHATSTNQVLIETFISDGWVLEPKDPP